MAALHIIKDIVLGKDDTDVCCYCGECVTVTHTVLECTRCKEGFQKMESVEDIMKNAIMNIEIFEAFSVYIKKS